MLCFLAALALCVNLIAASPSKKEATENIVTQDWQAEAAILGVSFFHHTRTISRQLLELDLPDHQLGEMFDVTKETRVILHGYLDNADSPWVYDLTDGLLNRTDQNVLVVDWSSRAGSIDYMQAVTDSRSVAALLAALLRRLIGIGTPANSFHLIGHSLGAHLAGYVGSEIIGIDRITGLDPAGPAFENTSPETRLDPSDADFVDVIHTNAAPLSRMGFGYVNPCGTVDFYPNGGRHQPGCYGLLGSLLAVFSGDNFFDVVCCDHLRAVYLFIDSVTSGCQMLAASTTLPCDVNVTAMGYDVNQNASGQYDVKTRSHSPFCTI